MKQREESRYFYLDFFYGQGLNARKLKDLGTWISYVLVSSVLLSNYREIRSRGIWWGWEERVVREVETKWRKLGNWTERLALQNIAPLVQNISHRSRAGENVLITFSHFHDSSNLMINILLLIIYFLKNLYLKD